MIVAARLAPVGRHASVCAAINVSNDGTCSRRGPPVSVDERNARVAVQHTGPWVIDWFRRYVTRRGQVYRGNQLMGRARSAGVVRASAARSRGHEAGDQFHDVGVAKDAAMSET
jgi:hypothetical protein